MNSPEGFIRLKARSLPVDGCWINEDWEDTGSVYTIVARRHPNGNITAGIYFVDLLCLGIKKVQILFDITADNFEGVMKLGGDTLNVEKVEYALVHNIIYDGLDYAKKFGFEPCSEFEIARHILEEDTAKHRKYDIECGVEGKPMFIQTELESDAQATQIMAQLEKTVGPGNFYHKDNMPALNELEELIAGMFGSEGEPEDSIEVDKEEIENSLTFQFKIQIKNISKPPVWRRVTVPSYFTFEQLHYIIRVVFGWSGAHLYSFSPRGYGSSPEITSRNDWDVFSDTKSDGSLDAAETQLSAFFDKEGQKMVYIYDFGDDWTHVVTLEKIIPEITLVATCLAGKGACPPEDYGGAWGYEELKGILADKNHSEYAEMAEWLGLNDSEQWDANDFDLEETQDFLSSILPDYWE